MLGWKLWCAVPGQTGLPKHTPLFHTAEVSQKLDLESWWTQAVAYAGSTASLQPRIPEVHNTQKLVVSFWVLRLVVLCLLGSGSHQSSTTALSQL